jgi:hypothetical protein
VAQRLRVLFLPSSVELAELAFCASLLSANCGAFKTLLRNAGLGFQGRPAAARKQLKLKLCPKYPIKYYISVLTEQK